MLVDDGDAQGSIWLSPEGRTSWFVMDLQKLYSVTSFSIKNTQNAQYKDRWTTTFRVSVSTDNSGSSWQNAAEGTLDKSFEMYVFSSSVETPVKYVKFEILGIGTRGGGLGFFQANGYGKGSG